MDKVLKKRLVGTSVIVALAVIFLPMMLEGPGKETRDVSMQISIPERPSYDIPNRLAKTDPVTEPAPSVDIAEVAKPVEVPAANTAPNTTQAASVATKSANEANVVAQIPVVTEKKQDTREKVVQVPAAAKPQMERAEPKPAESPASQIKTATSSAGFVIQVGSFSKEGNAQSLTNRLKAAGYPAFVDASKIKNNDIFRVKVGPKESRKQANELRIELIDEEKLEGIIVRHP